MDEEYNNETPKKRSGIEVIAGAIIIAGLIIAGAIIMTNRQQVTPQPITQQTQQEEGEDEYVLDAISKLPPLHDPHLRGAENPKVTIVEFSDLECPFCEQFHQTMQRAVDTYGDILQWEYRHFPLSSIHPEALPAAIASECAAELGGNDAFWSFVDEVFTDQDAMSRSRYITIATTIGIDPGTFTTCIDEERYRDAVLADGQEAIDSGARGTPFSIVYTPDGSQIPFPGALPYENLQAVLESLQ